MVTQLHKMDDATNCEGQIVTVMVDAAISYTIIPRTPTAAHYKEEKESTINLLGQLVFSDSTIKDLTSAFCSSAHEQG
jgi:hypothetical protein